MVRGLAQVGAARQVVEVRPQRLDDLVAEQAVVVIQGEQLNELGGPAGHPPVLRRLLAVAHDTEPAEQFDADAFPPLLRGHPRHLARTSVRTVRD
jgi:hypothetical protein